MNKEFSGTRGTYYKHTTFVSHVTLSLKLNVCKLCYNCMDLLMDYIGDLVKDKIITEMSIPIFSLHH